MSKCDVIKCDVILEAVEGGVMLLENTSLAKARNLAKELNRGRLVSDYAATVCVYGSNRVYVRFEKPT